MKIIAQYRKKRANTLCLRSTQYLFTVSSAIKRFCFVFTLYIYLYIRDFDSNGLFLVKWTKRYRQLLLAKVVQLRHSTRFLLFFFSFSFLLIFVDVVGILLYSTVYFAFEHQFFFIVGMFFCE